MSEASESTTASMSSLIDGITKGEMTDDEIVSLIRRGGQAPQDYRFSTTNQIQHCWERFADWVDCMNITSNNHARCIDRAALYKNMCPNFRTDAWMEQMREGTFPGKGLDNPDI